MGAVLQEEAERAHLGGCADGHEDEGLVREVEPLRLLLQPRDGVPHAAVTRPFLRLVAQQRQQLGAGVVAPEVGDGQLAARRAHALDHPRLEGAGERRAVHGHGQGEGPAVAAELEELMRGGQAGARHGDAAGCGGGEELGVGDEMARVAEPPRAVLLVQQRARRSPIGRPDRRREDSLCCGGGAALASGRYQREADP